MDSLRISDTPLQGKDKEWKQTLLHRCFISFISLLFTLLFSEAFQRNSVRRYLSPFSYSYYLHGKAEMEDRNILFRDISYFLFPSKNNKSIRNGVHVVKVVSYKNTRNPSAFQFFHER